MPEKTKNVLEYHKILEQLAGCATCSLNVPVLQSLTPARSYDQACLLLAETDAACAQLSASGSFSFGDLPDVRINLKQAKLGRSLTPGVLLCVARILMYGRQAVQYGSDAPKELLPYYNRLVVNRPLEELLFSSVSEEEQLTDNASPELARIRRKLLAGTNRIKDTLEKMTRSSTMQKYLQDAIVTLRGDRYVLPVKAEHRGDVPGLVHDSSASGATLFIEPMAVVDANNELRQLYAEEGRETERILADLTGKVVAVSDEIVTTFETLLKLDRIFARARLSQKMSAVTPLLNQEGKIRIFSARHPLLDAKTTVPIDLYLGDEFDTLVITGPNTGGKTVALKTLGLFTLMGLSGLRIPAREGSELSFFSSVFADIGDEQSIEQSLSTFSAHMVHQVEILNRADAHSLVLLDELGAGTDPVEGAALAIAILEELRAKGARIAATTHYSELKLYALSTEGVSNAACEFDVTTLRPTYRLLIGVPGKSNAFAISERLGLSESVLNRARALLNEEDIKFEDVLMELEENRLKAEEERQTAAKYRREIQLYRNTLEQEYRKIEQKREKMLEDARKKAKNVIDEAQDEVDEMLQQMQALRQKQDQNALEGALRKTKGDLKKKREKINQDGRKEPEGAPLRAGDLLLGMEVYVPDLEDTAFVLTLPDAEGNLKLQAGIMTVTTNLKDIRPIKKKTAPKKNSAGASRGKTHLKSASFSTELDLRGMLVEEAEMEIDRYLDQAVLNGLATVTLIHGKGTGALRAGVHQMLRRHPHVRTYRLGTFGEGDSGVTIVELK